MLLCGCKGFLCDKAPYYLSSGHYCTGPRLLVVTTTTTATTTGKVSNTLQRRLQRQRFKDRVLIEVEKSNQRLLRHHGSAGMPGRNRWNKDNYNNGNCGDYNNDWHHVGRGQRRGRWDEQQWQKDANALEAKIDKANKNLVTQLAQIMMGGTKGKGKGKGKGQGEQAGAAAGAAGAAGWACPKCNLWHNNPTCQKCRTCGEVRAGAAVKEKEKERNGKGKGKVAGPAGAEAEQAGAVAQEAAPLNPMHSPQSFSEFLDQEWSIAPPQDDGPPLEWAMEEQSTEDEEEQNQLKAMIALNRQAPQSALRDKVIADLSAQIRPAKPTNYSSLSQKEQADKQVKLMHMDAEWTKRFAARRLKAEKAAEEASKKLEEAQANLTKRLQEQQERYEEEATCKARMKEIREHFFPSEESSTEAFTPPAKLAAQVTPQQIQVIAQETIDMVNPDAMEFKEMGFSGDAVKAVLNAMGKQMVIMQEQKQAQESVIP